MKTRKREYRILTGPGTGSIELVAETKPATHMGNPNGYNAYIYPAKGCSMIWNGQRFFGNETTAQRKNEKRRTKINTIFSAEAAFRALDIELHNHELGWREIAWSETASGIEFGIEITGEDIFAGNTAGGKFSGKTTLGGWCELEQWILRACKPEEESKDEQARETHPESLLEAAEAIEEYLRHHEFMTDTTPVMTARATRIAAAIRGMGSLAIE